MDPNDDPKTDVPTTDPPSTEHRAPTTEQDPPASTSQGDGSGEEPKDRPDRE